MLPVLALVGRPNVGKSTLFNRLTATRNALVADVPGLTRDRHYGYAFLGERRVVIIDTGGLAGETELAEAAEVQTWRAIAEADHVLFLVDSRAGLAAADEELARRLRASGKPVWLLANKSEGLPPAELAEFHRLGFERMFPLSALRSSGIAALTEALCAALPVATEDVSAPEQGLTVTVIGRPNVGKSTLVNRLLGEERLLASEVPGTTRDAIRVPLERDGRHYVLIDTAGFRRRTSVEPGAERLGVLAAIRGLEEAAVAIVMTDAGEGVTAQDQRLVRLALGRGRAVVIALNKWDGLAPDARNHAAVSAEQRFAFVPFVRRVRISALHGSGIGELMAAVNKAGAAVETEFTTAELNRVLETLVAENPPPLIRGRRVKLRYAHPVGTRPPRLAIHGTQADRLPAAYRRYLAAGFRDAFRLVGVPLEMEFKSPPNPYAGKPRDPRPRRRRKP
ncbi:MAG: ribosome biogenesis GTPase Der [Gammaproteobacteria bacterium]